MSKEFDPQLKAAAKEIKEILIKYDAQAAFVLVSPTHAECMFHFASSWGVISHTGDSAAFRFRSKGEDFKSKEEQTHQTDLSVHSLTTILQFAKMTVRNVEVILTALRKHMNIVYGVWK